MAINRAPWNTLVDDDGSNLVGSIWNKAAIKTVLLDPIDGALLPWRFTPAAALVWDSGIVFNDIRPIGGDAAVVWHLSGPAGSGATGIQAEADGTQHLLINVAGNPITFYNQHPNSQVANRIIGPGFANYVLGVWASAWIIYSGAHSVWIFQKA